MDRKCRHIPHVVYFGMLFVAAALVLSASVYAAGTQAAGKNGSITIIYGITSVLALVLAVCCYRIMRSREKWFLVLYASVFVVNLGYFALSVSGSLEAAMLANSISYLGSAFLPLSMLMIIMKFCRIQMKQWGLVTLTVISILTFLLAASGDSLGLYYKEVTVQYIGGVAALKKVYGPLHGWYLIYLLSYFTMMVAGILHSFLKKRLRSYHYALILVSLVLGNIGVWYIEQLIDWNFEFLSVTYIITELFLLLLYGMVQDYEHLQDVAASSQCREMAAPAAQQIDEQRIAQILSDCPLIDQLTTREKEVLRYLLRDVPRYEIAGQLFVTENTVKKHTSNIFFKLEVSSRRELYEKLSRQTPTTCQK